MIDEKKLAELEIKSKSQYLSHRELASVWECAAAALRVVRTAQARHYDDANETYINTHPNCFTCALLEKDVAPFNEEAKDK